MGTVVADAPVSLRVRATLDSNPKDFNGALVSCLDDVEILMSETVEGTVFYYIKAGKKKGRLHQRYDVIRVIDAVGIVVLSSRVAVSGNIRFYTSPRG